MQNNATTSEQSKPQQQSGSARAEKAPLDMSFEGWIPKYQIEMICGVLLWGLRRFRGLVYMNPELLVANIRGDPAWLKLEGFGGTRLSIMPFLRKGVLRTKLSKKNWISSLECGYGLISTRRFLKFVGWDAKCVGRIRAPALGFAP